MRLKMAIQTETCCSIKTTKVCESERRSPTRSDITHRDAALQTESYGTLMFITVFTKTGIGPRPEPVQLRRNTPCFTEIRFNIILTSTSTSPNGLFPRGFPTKILNAISLSSRCQALCICVVKRCVIKSPAIICLD
jgi:hypothetical protein